ncbi:hypothetical protein Tco_1321441, partial [Tanacetum coccineum]
ADESSDVKWNDSLAIRSILIGSETWQQIKGQDLLLGEQLRLEGQDRLLKSVLSTVGTKVYAVELQLLEDLLLSERIKIGINKWYQSFALRNFDLEVMEFESAHGNNEDTSSKAILAIDGVGKPQQDDTGFVDSGCSRHMTRNIAYLLDFKEFDRESKTSRPVKRGRDTKIPQSSGPLIKAGDEVVHKELGDRMERDATTASSLEAKQDSGSGYQATAKTKMVNGERHIQSLIDKKKVIIMEIIIRSDLHLEGVGGTDCLPTATIFKELARMRYEKPSQSVTFYKALFSPTMEVLNSITITQCLVPNPIAWNEFSSTMASLSYAWLQTKNLICLSTFFVAMVKHLDGGVKFLMYPARRRGKVYKWETATYGKIWYDKDVHDLRCVETEFPAIMFNDTLMSEPTVSSPNNNEIDFRISFDESDDEDYTPTVSCFEDLDFFKDFEDEFLAIVYNDAQTSKLDFLTEPTDNDDDKDDIEHSSRDLSVKPLPDQKARILELKQRYFEDYYFDNQYAVSIKEDTPYPSRKIRRIRAYTHQIPQRKQVQYAVSRKGNTPYSRNIVCEYSGRYQTWSLLQETLIRRIQNLGCAVSTPTPDPINTKLKNEF